MQDQQDNTFPIPAVTPPNNQVGGAAPPPVGSPPPEVLPTPSESPIQPMAGNAQPQPLQPDWASQAMQDTNELPAGADNYAINTQSQPSVDGSMPAPIDPTQPPAPANVPPQAPTPEPFPVSTPQPQLPPEPAPYQPVPAEPHIEPTPPPTTAIPFENTLDLSGQNVPLEPIEPAPAVPAPQDGLLQPGVDIAPSTGLPPLVGDTQDPSLGNLPTDFGDSNNAIAANMASADAKKKIPRKFMIIGGGALAFLVIVSLILYFVARSQPKPAVDLNQAQVDQTQQATDNTTTVPAAIPEGFKKVDRDCYSFGVFVPTTLDFSKTVCKITAKFGSVSQYDITITPVTDNVTDLQALVDQSKVGTITSQEDIKLGGVAAKKVIQKVNGLDQQTILVIPTNKNFQFDGKTINGFIINTSYNDDTAKKASDTLVSTWIWK